MRYKIFVTVGVGVVILLAVGGLVLVSQKVAELTMPSNEHEQSDSLLGLYNERPTAVQGEASYTPVDGCGLSFTLTPTSRVVVPGGEIVYDAVVENRGTARCEHVSFSVYYSDQERFISATPAPSSSTYYWSVGTLAPRERKAITIRTRAGEERVSTEACATADNAADVCPQATVLVQAGGSAPVAVAESTPHGTHEYGTWIWESPRAMSGSYRESLLDEAAAAGFDAVYVTIDDYLSVDALPTGSAKNAAHAAYEDAVEAFVLSAAKRNIAVDLEGGARDWAEPANRSKGYALLEFVRGYNDSHPHARVRGFQYDVEPYLLQRYEGNKAAVLKEFVEFIDASTRTLDGSTVQFSVVLPHFYDSAQAWTPAFSYGGRFAHAYTHLLDILETRPGSTILIMAYRNFIDGEDGTALLVQSELDEAAGKSTKVLVAQETGNVEPSYVTFYGSSKNEFLKAVARLYTLFGSHSAFGGVAVHYLDSYLALKK